MNYIDKLSCRDILNSSDIEECIYSFVRENRLNGYVIDIDVIDRNDKKQDDYALGSYNRKTKKILINVPRIEKLSTRKIINLGINSFYRTNFYNSLLLHVIYHELIHAWQRKVSDNSVESKILKAYSPATFDPDFYSKYHDLLPSEREANILASDMVLKLYNDLSVLSDDEKNILVERYMHYLTDMYTDDTYPFFELLSLYNKRTVNSELAHYKKGIDKLSLFSRVKFGFELEDDEYNYLMRLNNHIEPNMNPKTLLRTYEVVRR